MHGAEHRHEMALFGSEVTLLIGPPTRPDASRAHVAALEIEILLTSVHRRLTRFDPTSELSRMNNCKLEEVRVSPLLAIAIEAGLWAADLSDGLVDPTLVGELEANGYASSKLGHTPASLVEALDHAPARRPALPNPDSRWRDISIDSEAQTVRRPIGLRFDTGGCGKGMAADLAAERLGAYESFVVDAGGDIRAGGTAPQPRSVSIQHPMSAEPAFELTLTSGAIATSGIGGRIWAQGNGYAHHLIDPSSGRPAWTGVVQATAVAETALEAETLAKIAVLSGPAAARSLLSVRGGAIVLDDGSVEALGDFARVGAPA